jgi:tetratricopeptide (TPR) repeat protein
MKRLSIALSLSALAACATVESNAQAALAALEEGRAAAGRQELPEAVELYSEAVRLNPELAEAYYERGIVLVRLRLSPDSEGDSRTHEDRALADFSAAIRKNPAFADAYFNRAMLRSSRAQYKPAVEDLLNAVRFRNQDAEAHLALGQIYETKFEDRAVSAMEHYEKYVELGGTDAGAREKVKLWKQIKAQAAAPAPAGAKPPGPDDERKAQELHEQFKRDFSAGNKKEALEALEQLMGTYGRTKYAQQRAREFGALLGALKR